MIRIAFTIDMDGVEASLIGVTAEMSSPCNLLNSLKQDKFGLDNIESICGQQT